MTSKKVTKNFRYPCLPKRGSKFHNFTNSYLRGPPVANFLTLYNSGSDQLSNELATILWPFLPGASQAWGPPASGHPNTLQLRHCFDTHILILPVSATCYSSTAIYIIYIDAERVIWMRSESSELAYTGKSQKYPPICMAKY